MTSRAPDPGQVAGVAPGGLLHPAWLLSLILLIVNDHLLKTSGLLPEPLTGKLSDFAGLIVAPVLLAHLFGARRAQMRAFAFGLVAAVFSAINLFPAVAAQFDAALRSMGIPWGGTVVDPTDLIALLVLPIAWRVCDPAAAEHAGCPRPREADRARSVWARRSLACVGVLACAASSPQPQWATPAFVANQTDADQKVRVRWPQASLDCEDLAVRAQRAFDPAVFGTGAPFTLRSGETFALAREDPNGLGLAEPQIGPMLGGATCDAALVEVEGTPEILVLWSDLQMRSVPINLGTGDVPDHLRSSMVAIRSDDADRPIVTAGADLHTAAPAVDILPDHCGADRSERYGWTEVPGRFHETLADLREGDDGCLSLDFTGRPAPFHLCIPASEFPFSVGDALDVDALVVGSGRGLSIRRGGVAPTDLFVYAEVETLDAGWIQGDVVDRGCGGSRLACGSFLVPSALELTDGSRLVAGSAVELVPPYLGRTVRVRVGRAERLAVGAIACEVGRDTAGPRIDVLVLDRR